MQTTERQREAQHESKTKLLDAALRVIRAKGYGATRIDDVCEAAGLTKGSFFHHFNSKEELALEAAEYSSLLAEKVFLTAPYLSLPDPLERLVGYVEFRKAILQGDQLDYTCLLGTMVQETCETHPAIRKACDRYICAHAATLVPDIEAAIRKYGIQPAWTAESLAYHIQAVMQGAFVLARSRQSAQVAVVCLDHLRRYLKTLFLYSSNT